MRPSLRPLFTARLRDARPLCSSAQYPAANRLYSDKQLRRKVADWRTEWTPGPLTPQETDQFWEHGFVVKKLFEPAELQPAIDAIEQLVEDLAQVLSQQQLHRLGCFAHCLAADASSHRPNPGTIPGPFVRDQADSHRAGVP